jgi:NAD+ diphosphatase
MDRGTEEGLSRARGIIHWDTTSRFCGRCGSEMNVGTAEPVKKCPSCGLSSYPRITPAVIILIMNKDKILLAHNRRFPENLYSCVAGFVETGETLEDAVRREIREETGIEVAHLRYFGNQPWPFPSSLMIAFLADYAGGSIILEDDDISDAKWFSRDNLPDLPLHGSISRELIDWFLENETR